MLGLTERQLEIMQQTYRGFKDMHDTMQRVHEGARRYRAMLENGPAFIPVLEAEKSTQA